MCVNVGKESKTYYARNFIALVTNSLIKQIIMAPFQRTKSRDRAGQHPTLLDNLGC